MRVLRFLFSSVVVIGICVAVFALGAREVLLYVGVSKIKSSLSVLHRVSRDNLQFARQCREKGGVSISADTIGGLQLRFLNSREYVLEVVCAQFQSDPIIIIKESLPFLVKKNSGSSGIIWGKDRSAVELNVFGRKSIVGVENEEIKDYAAGSISLGISPATSCEGYGFMCCQAETFSGVGQSFSGVTDCPRGCFTKCLPRPIILSLATDPFPDDRTRTVFALAGQPITFSYVASYDVLDKRDTVTVTIDFGDGQQENFDRLNSRTTHQYTCPQGTCSFNVKISAKTSSGVESAVTATTHLTVQVGN
jgi:hypothetical protein